jgi:micrococcal nuclease
VAIWAAGAAAALVACAGATSGGPVRRATVTSVVDGDTIHVALDGHDEKVRLIGIDTPEMGQCGAAKATALARKLAGGATVTLIADPTQATRDRYNRLLAYVVLPTHRDLGYEELAHGYGHVYVYDRPFKRLSSYRRGERFGKSQRDSIWRLCAQRRGP